MRFCALRDVALRYVEKQSMIATVGLAKTPDDQRRLEELLEDSKPPCGDAQGLHWLLQPAFRYPPLRYGSRFGTRQERGILYTSLNPEALYAEAAFYAWQFIADMAAQPPEPVQSERSVIAFDVATDKMVDVAQEVDPSPMLSPTSWAHSQPYGRAVRELGGEAIGYPSARLPGAAVMTNVAILTPGVVAQKGAPRIAGSFTTVTGPDGVSVHTELQPAHHYAAAKMSPAPWHASK